MWDLVGVSFLGIFKLPEPGKSHSEVSLWTSPLPVLVNRVVCPVTAGLVDIEHPSRSQPSAQGTRDFMLLSP